MELLLLVLVCVSCLDNDGESNLRKSTNAFIVVDTSVVVAVNGRGHWSCIVFLGRCHCQVDFV